MTAGSDGRPPLPRTDRTEAGATRPEGPPSRGSGGLVSSPQGERPKLAWSDLRGARVGVWGLGREGAANVRKLAALGVEPVLVDDSPRDGSVLPTAEGGLDALAACDVVVKTPGISRYRPEAEHLREAGITLTGGLGLWIAEADRDRVVCVTGTKGKSTTSSVLGHLLTGLSELKGTGKRAGVGGNIGVLPYDPQVPGAYDYWVIEVSSYQATDLAFSPPVVAVTSLHPDHLPWHGGVEQYYRDKLSACSQAGADLTIANGDSELLRERFPLMGPRVEWVSEADEPGATWMDALGLPGGHNRRNALIARACLRALNIPGAGDDAALAAAAAGYQGLPSRLTTIGVVDGVTFVDDSLSTNVLPTLAALDAFPGQPVALIVGGQDRGIDYGELADGVLARQAATLVLTLPDSGPRISAVFTERAELKDRAVRTGHDDDGTGMAGVIDCPDLKTAVSEAFTWARSAGNAVVLLSPAAPSFGHFRDYRDRAQAFAAAMRACPGRLRQRPSPGEQLVLDPDAQVVGEQWRQDHELQRVDRRAAQGIVAGRDPGGRGCSQGRAAQVDRGAGGLGEGRAGERAAGESDPGELRAREVRVAQHALLEGHVGQRGVPEVDRVKLAAAERHPAQ